MKRLIATACTLSGIVILGTFIAYYRSSLIHFDGYIDKDYFPAFGGFIASMVGVVLSTVSMILIYYTYRSQQRLFEQQTKAISEQQKVYRRDYLKYVDSIRPIIELKFEHHIIPTSYGGIFTLEIKENSTHEIDVKNATIIPINLSPPSIHREYLSKNTPIKFRYSRSEETDFPDGIKGEIMLKISYDDSMYCKYEQTFTSIIEQRIFVSTVPVQVGSWREQIKLD